MQSCLVCSSRVTLLVTANFCMRWSLMSNTQSTIMLRKSVKNSTVGRPRRGSAADRLLWLRFRMPTGAWMPVICECCVVWPIPRAEESYWLVGHCVWPRNLKNEKDLVYVLHLVLVFWQKCAENESDLATGRFSLQGRKPRKWREV